MKKIICLSFFLFFLSCNLSSANSLSENNPYKSPEIEGVTKWFNTENPIKIKKQNEKIILVDFWTYSCINCIRNLTYLKKLHENYHDKGLVIIGVHSPEFDFEKSEKNVEMAIKKFGIKYPVAMDNEMNVWKDFKNQFWPTHYLINKDGEIVYTKIGEGDGDILEGYIKKLLNIKDSKKTKSDPLNELFFSQTPETYLGYERSERNISKNVNEKDDFKFPQKIPLNYFAIDGKFQIKAQYSEAKSSESAIRLHFRAKNVFLVMSSDDNKNIQADIKFNGKKVGNDIAGKDVKNGIVTISESRLYHLIEFKDNEKQHDGILEIKARSSGLRFYAFTFGS